MTAQESIDIRLKLLSMSIIYRQYSRFERVSRIVESQRDLKPPTVEIDPDYVRLHFGHSDQHTKYSFHTLDLRKEQVTRLNLMVGDTLTLRLSKN